MRFQGSNSCTRGAEGSALKYFSEYSDDVGFKSMGQDVILSHHLHDDDDKMYEVQCSLAQSDTYRLFSDNPLQMGYFLGSISCMEYIM